MTRRRRRTKPKLDPNNLTGLRVGLYCRVSSDPHDTQKSVGDQEADGLGWVDRVGAHLVETYIDNDRSASRFRDKEREEFERLLDDIRADKLDLVWVWEQSRLTRVLSEFAAFCDLCLDNEVLFAIGNKVIEPGSSDMMTSGIMGAVAAQYSEETSQRVLRGKASNARKGRPPGKVPYGYRRVYHPETRQLVEQVPDWTADGEIEANSPADVVRDIFDHLAGGGSLARITRELNERHIPTPRGAPEWEPTSVRTIAKNAAYAALVVHQGQVLEGVKAGWPPLVDGEKFWAVQRILTADGREKTRPSRAQSLLSWVAKCDDCGGQMGRHASGNGRLSYTCRQKSCTSIGQDVLDAHVTEHVIRWLRRPDVYEDLSRADNSEVATQARAEVEQKRHEVAEIERASDAGDLDIRLATGRKKRLTAEIAEAEKRAITATFPPLLRGRVGPDAGDVWEQLDNEVRRQIISLIVDIRVKSTGLREVWAANRAANGNGCGTNAGYVRHQRRGEKPCQPCRDASNADRLAHYHRGRAGLPAPGKGVPIDERVTITPLIGPGAEGGPPEPLT